jgi:DNA polymerase V
MSERIALVDCNNFYVSCEQVFQPHLKNTPVAILSNNDGSFIARSNDYVELADERQDLSSESLMVAK